MEGHTRKIWEMITGHVNTNTRFEGQTVLDIGCGSGRFTDIVRSKGAKVIGIDFSLAVEAAQENFKNDPDVLIIQGDLLHLPIKSLSIDGAFSIGVLHHTPDPEGGVGQASDVLKNGGWFAFSVYEKNGFYDKVNVQALRKFFKKLWPYFQHYPPLIYSYLAVYLLSPFTTALYNDNFLGRFPFPFIKLADKKWSLLDTFDSVTPSYQSGHTLDEVLQWMKNNKFTEIRSTDWGMASCRGIKQIS